MKSRRLSIFLALLLALAMLSGCAYTPAPDGAKSGGVTIAASFYPIYIMLMNITSGIQGVRIVDMTQPSTGCLHDYSVTPRDMRELEGADFLAINGAGMESFMGKVIAQFPSLQIIDSSTNIPLLTDDTGSVNPHIWVSVSNAILQVRNIAGQLSALDPARAAAYEANADAYAARLEALKARMHAALDGAGNKDIITFHEAFPYFAREFGLRIAGVIEREPGAEPSARELAAAIDKINALRITALFAEPQYPSGAARVLMRETGAKLYTLDPAVTGPAEKDAYIAIMESNLQTLEEALK
jgi:zinc transport system substrate-binding protein